MQAAPALRADPVADVEARARARRRGSRRRSRARSTAARSPSRTGRRSRAARVQPAVAEQRDAVDGDRDQAGERGVLVDGDQRAAQPGRARRGRPSPGRATDSVISASATSPDARLASHQPYSIGSRPVMPPRHATAPPSVERPTATRRRRRRGRARRRGGAAALGAGQQRRLRERLGLRGGGRDGRGGDDAGPGGLAGGRVDQVVARPRPHARASTPEVATAAVASASTAAGSPVERVADVDRVGAVHADVAAAVDGARAAARAGRRRGRR